MIESDADDFESADEGEAESSELQNLTQLQISENEKNIVQAKDAISFDSQESNVMDLTSFENKIELPDDSINSLPKEKENFSEKMEVNVSSQLPDHSINPLPKEEPKLSNEVNVSSLFDKLADPESPKSSGWGWSSWGASLVSTATSSVAVFTNQVGEGLTTVIGSVDGVLGIPPAEELAKEQTAITEHVSGEQSEHKEKEQHHGLFSSLSSLSNVVESTGNKMLNTGLDTLELIGKKTMNVIQDGDPGLKKTRSLFFESKPNLSEILREAKSKSETNMNFNDIQENKKINYHILFDDYQGLVHLEALEMLAKQCEDRVSCLTSSLSPENWREDLKIINQACNLDDLEDSLDNLEDFDFDKMFVQQVKQDFQDIKISGFQQMEDGIKNHFADLEAEFDSEAPPPMQEIHDLAIKTLAEFTALSMEFLHKLGEVILLNEAYGENMAEKISSNTKALCIEINCVSAKFSEYINKPLKMASYEDDNINVLTTNVFLEASNSSTYVQDALRLLVPILQESFLKNQQRKLSE